MKYKKEIIEWARNKDLLKPENASKQFIKTIEETGELAKALLKNDKNLQIDSIGDITVTLIILAEQLGLGFEKCLETAYNEIKDRTGKTVDGTFIKNE